MNVTLLVNTSAGEGTHSKRELRRTLDKYRDLASRVKGSGLNACESCGTDTRNPCRTVRVSRSAGGVQTNHMEIRCDNCSPRKS